MGTNFVGSLDAAPQTGAVVSLLAAPGLPGQIEAREVLRCPHCQLVQFRTANNHCRRCRVDVDARPLPPPSPVQAVAPPAVEGEIEPGIETAEATGTLVPDVAGAIRNWRQRCGLSQRQLADRMHVPRTYVSKIENDKAMPTITSLERMATAMETNIAVLLASVEGSEGRTAEDDFAQALLPMLAQLSIKQREQLLRASRRLAAAAPGASPSPGRA